MLANVSKLSYVAIFHNYFYTCSSVVCICFVLFFFKQKTAYEMRISDWSSDVCSSDLHCSGECGKWRIDAPARAEFALDFLITRLQQASVKLGKMLDATQVADPALRERRRERQPNRQRE